MTTLFDQVYGFIKVEGIKKIGASSYKASHQGMLLEFKTTGKQLEDGTPVVVAVPTFFNYNERR